MTPNITWVNSRDDPTHHITEPGRWEMNGGWNGPADVTTMCGLDIERQDHSTLEVHSRYYQRFIATGNPEWIVGLDNDLLELLCLDCVFAAGELLRSGIYG